MMAVLALRRAFDRHCAVRLRAVMARLAFHLAVSRVVEAAWRISPGLLQGDRMDVLARRSAAHTSSGSAGIIEDVAVAVDALVALRLELVRDVTLYAVLDHRGRQPAMHGCNAVDRCMTAGACPDCLARCFLLVRIMTCAALCIMRVLAIELLGNARPHFMAAQTLLRFRLE